MDHEASNCHHDQISLQAALQTPDHNTNTENHPVPQGEDLPCVVADIHQTGAHCVSTAQLMHCQLTPYLTLQ